MELKYGCNPHQAYAAVEPIDAKTLPIEVLNGKPSMIRANPRAINSNCQSIAQRC